MNAEEKFFSPSEVADALGISAATLRKYSLIVEDVANGTDYFARNNQKARLYTQQNLDDLKKLQNESKKGEKTLKEIAQEIFIGNKSPENISQEPISPQENNELIKTLQQMQQTMMEQNKIIQQLNQKVNELEQNPDIAGKNSAPEIISQDDLKIKSVDLDDDLPDLEELKKAQEEMKPNVDARAEIMRKSYENAEKGNISETPRTLADMQLPKEKNHWWNRFTE